MQVEFYIENVKGENTRRRFNPTTNELEEVGETQGAFPFHYGFIPNTHNPHSAKQINSALDAFLISEEAFTPGTTTQGKVVGVILLENGDHKIALVGVDSEIVHYAEFDETMQSEIQKWFSQVSPVEGWGGPMAAKNLIEEMRIK